MHKPKILAFAGSLRQGSHNKKLIKVAAEAAHNAGAEVTLIDLRDYPMPIYDGNIEANLGLPEHARQLKTVLREHDGFFIASPEYNSSISGVLKNTIDWASRAETDDEPPLVAFRGKVAALISASPGNLGGLRSLVHLRSILGNINVLVLPEQQAIPQAHNAFSEDGALVDERMRNSIERIATRLVQVAGRLNA